MKRLSQLVLVVVLALLSAATTGTAAPVPERFVQIAPVRAVYEPCGAVETVVYTVEGTRFLDQSGTVVRTQLQVGFEGTITVPRTGEVVAESGHQTLVLDGDGGFAFAGVSFSVHVPGQGVILLEAGRLVLDADGTVVTQSDKTAVDLAEKVCAALG